MSRTDSYHIYLQKSHIGDNFNSILTFLQGAAIFNVKYFCWIELRLRLIYIHGRTFKTPNVLLHFVSFFL